jgi:hypothetical protein
MKNIQKFYGLPRHARLAVLTAAGLFVTTPVFAGPGCDINLRVNNKTPNSVMVYASKSSASKAGLNLWSPIRGFSDALLDPKNSGAASHSKQAVELKLPCWTGKIDFKIKYLDGSNERWKYRRGVKVKAGDTIQVNLP